MPIIRLFFANIDYATTEPEIRDFFTEAGRPTVINIIKDKETNKPKGFGFVTLDTMGEDKDCWRSKLQGKELGGRSIHIDFAIPKKN
jgi:RNA recognition motif-containing protein